MKTENYRNIIVRNAIVTPDGTLLDSRHRHDYKEHVDAITGETYMVDGGFDYMRGMKTMTPPKEDLRCALSDGHEKVREMMTWGTYGKNGDQPRRNVPLKTMTDDHIRACLDMAGNMLPQFRYAMEVELAYRRLMGIEVEDSAH